MNTRFNVQKGEVYRIVAKRPLAIKVFAQPEDAEPQEELNLSQNQFLVGEIAEQQPDPHALLVYSQEYGGYVLVPVLNSSHISIFTATGVVEKVF